jgi:hypothetical protein
MNAIMKTAPGKANFVDMSEIWSSSWSMIRLIITNISEQVLVEKQIDLPSVQPQLPTSIHFCQQELG